MCYVFTARPDRFPGIGCGQDQNLTGAVGIKAGVFLHHDGVSAGRQWGAGKQPHAGAGDNAARSDISGSNFSHQAQTHGCNVLGQGYVGRAHGVAIHGGVIEDGQVDRRPDGLSQNSPRRIDQRDPLAGRSRHSVEHPPERFFKGEHAWEQGLGPPR